MSRYEFEVIPAPETAGKKTDLTKDQDVYCATVAGILTDMGLAGWDFVGAETMPHHQRRFFFFSQQGERTCLVFRREISRKRAPGEAKAEVSYPPERKARPAMVAHFNAGERRLNVSPPKPKLLREPPEKAAPLRLDNPVVTEDDDTIIPIRLHRSKEARAALDALERAVTHQHEHRDA